MVAVLPVDEPARQSSYTADNLAGVGTVDVETDYESRNLTINVDRADKY